MVTSNMQHNSQILSFLSRDFFLWFFLLSTSVVYLLTPFSIQSWCLSHMSGATLDIASENKVGYSSSIFFQQESWIGKQEIRKLYSQRKVYLHYVWMIFPTKSKSSLLQSFTFKIIRKKQNFRHIERSDYFSQVLLTVEL